MAKFKSSKGINPGPPAPGFKHVSGKRGKGSVGPGVVKGDASLNGTYARDGVRKGSPGGASAVRLATTGRA